jgi:hypothetical protein
VAPSCPPPTITSFSPLTGVSGTILTIVGKNLDEVTGVTINNVTTITGITILNEFNISVVVPYSNTIIVQNNPIIIRGTHGDSSTIGNFTYNPNQQTPTTPSSIPNTPPSVNTQPQQTGPLPLTGTTTYGISGGAELLKVNVNPAAGGWKIIPEFTSWNYKIVKRSVGPNNTIIETTLEEQKNLTDLSVYVSSNKLSFEITDFDIASQIGEVSDLTNEEINTASFIYNTISLVATADDKYVKFNVTNNSKDVIQDVYLPFAFPVKFG